MTTITVDIIDDKALNLLKDLEALNVIRLHDKVSEVLDRNQSIINLKGKMTKQTVEEIEMQLAEFREE